MLPIFATSRMFSWQMSVENLRMREILKGFRDNWMQCMKKICLTLKRYRKIKLQGDPSKFYKIPEARSMFYFVLNLSPYLDFILLVIKCSFLEAEAKKKYFFQAYYVHKNKMTSEWLQPPAVI